MISFRHWLQKLVSSPKKRPANRRTFRPVIEELEPRVVPAWNMTLSSAPTNAEVSVVTSSGITTFTATGTGANLDWTDVSNAFAAENNVVINSGSTGTEAGNITNESVIGLGGFSGSLTLTLQSGTGTNLVGNITLGSISTTDANLSVIVSAAGNVTTSDLSAGVPTPLASVQITTTGGSVSTISGGSIYATNLAVQAKGNIGSSGSPLSTNVGNLVANVTGTTGGVYINNTGALNIGVPGAPFQGVVAPGAINLNDTGSINITSSNESIQTEGGAIKLTTGVGDGFTLNNGDGSVSSSGGNITIAADSMVIDDPITAYNVVATGNVTLEQASTTTRNIVLGGTTSGNLAISDAMLGEITANVLNIGRTDNAGSITITGEVTTHTGYSILHLLTGAGISQSSTGSLFVSQLAIDAAGDVNLSTADNGVSVLAGNVTNGSFSFLNELVLTIGSVYGDTGVTAKGSVTIAADVVSSDILILAANVTSNSSTVDLTAGSSGGIVLAASTTLTGTTVNFHTAVGGGGFNLTITGDADFTSTVSTVGNLSVSGTTAINGNIGTTGTQTYTGAVTLDSSATLSSTGSNGNIVFQSAIEGAIANTYGLTVNTAGTTIFGGAVGAGGFELAGLTTDAGGDTEINGGSVTTGGGQTYNDDVTLGGNTTLTAGTVQFTAGLTLGPTAATATDSLLVNGNFTLATTASLTAQINTAASHGKVSVTTGLGSASIGANTILNANGGTGLAGGTFTLINTSSPISGTFKGQPEGSTVTLNGIPFTISYLNDDVTLTSQTPTTVYVDQTFAGTTPGNNPATAPTGLTLQYGYNAFDNIQSGLNELASGGTLVVFADNAAYSTGFTVSNSLTAIDFNENPQNGSAPGTFVQINGPVTLEQNTVFTQAVIQPGTNPLSAASLSLNSIVTGGTPVSLTVNGNSSVDTFNEAVGTLANPLSLVDIASSGLLFLFGNVTTTGGQTYDAPTSVDATVTLTGSTVTFGSTLQSQDGPGNLVVAGNAVFGGVVGGSGVDLNSLQVTGTTAIDTTSIETLGNQTYTGAVTLGANTTLTSDSGGNIAFASTVLSPGTPYSLTISTAGTTTFGGAVGGGSGNADVLGTLTVGGGGTTQINGGSINTTGFAQNYNENVTLGSAFTILAGIVNFNAGLTLGTSSTTATSELQIAGTLNFTSATTLTTTFTGTGSGQYGFIVVGGGNTTYGNATLDVIYAGGFTPAAGDSFDVVSNGGFGIGQFVNAPSPGIFAFGGVQYSAVYNGSDGGGDFIMTALNGNQTYIEALYQTFLGRTGSPAEWNSWVAALSSLGRAGVVAGIEYSPEALNRLVNELYLRFLNRPATGDPGAQTWVKDLQQGDSEEVVTAGILSSAEFANRANALIGTTNANYNYVQALYELLLNRTGSSAEVGYWENQLPSLGRFTVAANFLISPEYRDGAVRTFYGDPTLSPLPYQAFFPEFFDRTPAASELNYWVNLPLAVLGIEQDFAASNEFYDDNS